MSTFIAIVLAAVLTNNFITNKTWVDLKKKNIV